MDTGKKKILIVDDEVDFTRMIKLNLELTGKFTVRVENKGKNALSAAKEFLPDLILLDIIMPDMDGSDVGAALRQDASLKNIPVVFLTAIVSKNEIEEHCNIIGGNPFVAKPIDLKQLIACIEKNIRKI